MSAELRPMTAADVDAAVGVQARAFDALAASHGRPPRPRTSVQADRASARFRHLVATDPDGAWVAEDAGDLVGIGLALRREGLWALSQLAVEPTRQSQGLGSALLERTLDYAAGCWGGMIASSTDPRAMRRYAGAGFTLTPAVALRGVVQPDALAPAAGVREGDAADLEFAAAVDQSLRGAGHGADLELLLADPGAQLLVADRADARGYALTVDGAPELVAATTAAAATDLLTAALHRAAGKEVLVKFVTGEQAWAISVGTACGLAPEPFGPVFLRGLLMPVPYLPSGPYL